MTAAHRALIAGGGVLADDCGSARGLLFHRLAEQAMAVAPASYRAITEKHGHPSIPQVRSVKGIPSLFNYLVGTRK
jgi:hypothetical protein